MDERPVGPLTGVFYAALVVDNGSDELLTMEEKAVGPLWLHLSNLWSMVYTVSVHTPPCLLSVVWCAVYSSSHIHVTFVLKHPPSLSVKIKK